MIGIPRGLKNFLGSIRGFGSCPNCGDSWSWKPHRSIILKKENIPVVIKTRDETGAIIIQEGTVPCTGGIMICKECLENPAKLDPERIKHDLLLVGWTEEDAENARQHLIGITTA